MLVVKVHYKHEESRTWICFYDGLLHLEVLLGVCYHTATRPNFIAISFSANVATAAAYC